MLIYWAEADPIHADPLRAAVAGSPRARFAISPLVKMECLVGPIRRGDLAMQRHYEDFFGRYLTLPLSDAAYLLAAQLRARFGLKTPDALHLACAQHHRCDALWTNDDRLAKAGHGLARNVLK